MERSKLALHHLWVSLLVLAVTGCLVMYAWYPAPLLSFSGVNRFLLPLLLTAVLTAPFLSWLVYKEDKKALLLDITVIILIQAAAAGWATARLYENRPYFMVFTVDRFEVLRKQDVDLTSVPDQKLVAKPFRGPLLLYATMPGPGPAYQRLVREIMFEGKPDLQYRPEFWSLYAERHELAARAAKPLAILRRARAQSAERIDRWVNDHGGDIDVLGFVPGLMHGLEFTVVMDRNSGAVVGELDVDPWVDQRPLRR